MMENATELINYASKAPSSHNSQPWIFKVKEHSIEIHPDKNGALPIVDPDNRELYISLGCATENICLVSPYFNYNTELEIITTSNDYTFIKIRFKETSKNNNTTILNLINNRQSNRSIYTGKHISDTSIKTLESILTSLNINTYYFKNGTPEFKMITDYILKGNTIQMRDSKFKAELLSWIRFNNYEIKNTQNGLTYKVMGAPQTPRFIGKMVVKSFLTPSKQNKNDIEKINSSSHYILFTTKHNTVTEWIKLGRHLQHILLKLTELDIACAYMNPPCEIHSLSEELKNSIPIIKQEYPTLILRIGYANKVPYSPRKSINKIIVN
ncbi:hypothetical protein APS56_14650 [Pseudalgibacter alginicilyticus]|uniref:Nitroreductase n=2 Tax=Pseudalgibacter alginicilyticus TaxID=1736674 RepID=A0A0P0DBJ9_9FLAO|nr:hypothetical protein APS56_14650 [Pseudalgibacter alginicilyticus]